MKPEMEFVKRLRRRIAVNQGTDEGKISVARAASDIDVPETTLRSTLEGCFPRTEGYWRKLRTHCQATLDWLICGLGEGPENHLLGRPTARILVVEGDLIKLSLIKMALMGFQVEVACTPREAAVLISQNAYDLILAGDAAGWTEEGLSLLHRQRARPRLVFLVSDAPWETHPFGRIADQVISEPLVAERITNLIKEELSRIHYSSET